MKKGDIIFVKGTNLLSRTISYMDGGGYSHCAIAVSSHQVIEANYDTRVAVRHFEPLKYSEVDIVPIRATKVQRNAIVESALKHVGKRYDYFQIFGYAVMKALHLDGKNRFNNPNRVICSELIFLVLREVGMLSELNISDVDGVDLTPNQLYDLVMFAHRHYGL